MAVRGNVELSEETRKQLLQILTRNFQNAPETVNTLKLIPEKAKRGIVSDIRNSKWIGGVDWAVEKRK